MYGDNGKGVVVQDFTGMFQTLIHMFFNYEL